ncbi:tRNA pseudouridine(55) synthase TruB [Mogibacterium kristiansenii]|uniref:tRNA pseudouridine(55) synthase TruB n=1 Tax=Mogibacterium kristiansenii TaxID=2606708 RepID=UPI00240A337B|nr:tRNA pseudouridine(55) synthase TruB [Mogibacterium kristiansenii]MDD6699901.1 tRNA pseudouridine(55) synthase TruB [Mogibacterium kristiansenii]
MFENGILNINKPEGWTSQDVVAKLRGRLHIRRVGHTGTLDPMATGVLPVCFGKATRIIEYYDDDFKTYEAEMKLGMVTDTLDITGTVLETKPVDVSEEDVIQTIDSFRGWITQIPPKYSALKLNGKPLYKYAREGVEVEIKSRKIYVEDIQPVEVNLGENRILFRVTCSKGTYIRTICDDIGKKLGCGGTMTALQRIQSGCFRVEDARTLPEILEMTDEELERCVIPMDETLVHLGRIELKSMESVPFYYNGREIDTGYVNVLASPAVPEAMQKESRLGDKYRVYDPEGKFLGISSLRENTLYPEKVIR